MESMLCSDWLFGQSFLQHHMVFLFGEDNLCVQSLMSSMLTLLCVCVRAYKCSSGRLLETPACLPSAALRSVHLCSPTVYFLKHFVKE